MSPANVGRGRGTAVVVLAVLLVTGVAARGDAADMWALLARGQSLYQSGRLVEAWTVFAQAATETPGAARPALWLGAVAMARGNRAVAVAWFNEALRRHPSLAEQSCAIAWLRQLGVEVARPRWHLRSPAEYAVFVHAVNPSLSAAQSQWLGSTLLSAATRYGIDPRIVASVVFIESRFNHQSVSSAGAEGLGQLMPETAAGLGVDPRDPLQNLMGTAWLLRLNVDEFHSLPLALAAYNAGGGAVRRWGGIPPYAETQWYVWAVLWVYDGLRA